MEVQRDPYSLLITAVANSKQRHIFILFLMLRVTNLSCFPYVVCVIQTSVLFFAADAVAKAASKETAGCNELGHLSQKMRMVSFLL